MRFMSIATPLLRPQTVFNQLVQPRRSVTVDAVRWIASRQIATVADRTWKNESVEVVGRNGRMVMTWRDGAQTAFDNPFLLDHCRCPACLHPKTQQRLKPLGKVPLQTSATSIECEPNGIRIHWSTDDGHESYFPFSFLRKAAYDPPLRDVSEGSHRRTLWKSDIAGTAPMIAYASVVPTECGEEAAENGIMAMLQRVHEYGFCLVTGVPATPTDTEQVIRRIAHIRETHYGGFWDFTSDMSKGDLAYSSESLPAHTDTTYFSDPAGLQIFHLLSHPPPGTGGTTLLVDGFQAASLLETTDPAAYSTLSRLRVPAHASGTPGTLLRPVISQPVLRHDEYGHLAQVRWNNEDRGVIGQGWQPEDVKAWYSAAKRFEDLLTSHDLEYWIQLTPGTVIVIDNWRVLHGRSGFTGARRMCGAYIGADDWRSRLASLQRRSKANADDDIWTSGW